MTTPIDNLCHFFGLFASFMRNIITEPINFVIYQMGIETKMAKAATTTNNNKNSNF